MKKELEDLTKLKNIGEVTAKWLYDLGIKSKEDIEKFGVWQIYEELKMKDLNVTIILVYALQGALMDLNWTELPKEVKKQIDREARNYDF